MHGTYVLKNRKRFYTILLLALFIITMPVFASTVYGFKDPSYVSVNVKEGDNLWNIVSGYSQGRDIRKYIYEVKKLNKMQDSNIYPGQSILLPIK
jgi:LysM domain.